MGDPLFDEDKLTGYIDWITKNDAYTFLNGDIFDSAIEGSKGNTYEACMNITQAKLKAKELLMPIRDRILGITTGNHERRVWNRTGVDITMDLAMYLNLEDKYDAKGIVANIKINNSIEYDVYMKHGSGGGKTQAYRLKKLKELGDIVKNCDLYIMSHVHDILTFSLNPLFVSPTKQLYDKRQTYVTSGSFLQYGGYAEDLSFEPGKSGSPRVRLNASKRDIHISI